MKCKNCNGIARKNFCSTCGQHTGVGKINYKSVKQELFQAVFFIKNGFLFTLKELFLDLEAPFELIWVGKENAILNL